MLEVKKVWVQSIDIGLEHSKKKFKTFFIYSIISSNGSFDVTGRFFFIVISVPVETKTNSSKDKLFQSKTQFNLQFKTMLCRKKKSKFWNQKRRHEITALTAFNGARHVATLTKECKS